MIVMNLSLKPEMLRYVQEKVQSGRYASAEDVLEAGLEALRQQDAFGNFAPGELDELLSEGERSIEREGTVPAGEVFDELRRRSNQRRGSGKKG
jgi:putative addiction module CopG family antidote